MKTPADRIKQAEVEINSAIAKRLRAQKLWQEADEELVIARLKMEDAINEQRCKEAMQRLYG